MSSDWWKSDENVVSNSIQDKYPQNPEVIIPTLKNLVPVLDWSLKLGIYDNNSFWTYISECVYKLTQNNVDPVNKYSEFIEILYQNVKILNPQTLKDYIPFLKSFAKPPYSEFYLVTLAKLFQDPLLIVRLISELKYTNIPLYKVLQKERGFIEKFFDMYCTYLVYQIGAYDNSYWEIRLMIADLLVHMIINNIGTIILVDPMINFLRSKLVALITDAPMYQSVPFIRLIIQLDTHTLFRQTPEIIAKRLHSLLNNVKTGHTGNAMVIKFVASGLCRRYIDFGELMRTKYKQGFTSTSDLEIFDSPLFFFDPETCLQPIKILAHLLVHNSLWRKSAASFLLSALIICNNFEPVYNWFIKFLLNLKASILYTNIEDSVLIMEILTSKAFQEIDFISELFSDPEELEISVNNQLEVIKSLKPETSSLPFKPDSFNLVDESAPKHKGKGKKKGKKKKTDAQKGESKYKDEKAVEEKKGDAALPPRPKRKKGKKPVLTSDLIRMKKEAEQAAKQAKEAEETTEAAEETDEFAKQAKESEETTEETEEAAEQTEETDEAAKLEQK